MESVSIIAEEFKELEKKIYEKHMANARKELREKLEQIDEVIKETRDKEEYRHKGKRDKNIRTIMGEVKVERVIYLDNEAPPKSKKYVYLLDQLLGMCTIGKMSVNLVEQTAARCAEESFRKAAETLKTYTSQYITHQAIWDMFQKVGDRLEWEEKRKVQEFHTGETTGEREVPVLFEEADGVHLSLQRKKGAKRKGGSKEMKIGVAYEGWEKRHPKSKQYRTVEKLAYAGFMNSQEFHRLREAMVGKKYNLDEVKVRVLNGDGARWIKGEQDAENEIFQLDPYHLRQAIYQGVSVAGMRPHIRKWVENGEIAGALKRLEEMKKESGGLAKEVKQLEKLQTYLRNNRDGLQPYQKRLNIEAIQPPQGLEYRSLGTMERNVEIFDRRMDGPLSWSIRGANHMAKVLAHKISGTLDEALAGIWEYSGAKKLEHNTEVPVVNPGNRRIKKNLKDQSGSWKIRQGGIPYQKSSMTIGRRIIRNLFNCRELEDLGF